MMNDYEGVYTRTQAFNFLKDLLEIPKKAKINKTFFSLFFKECDEMFVIRKPEDIIKRIFTENAIARINEEYFLLKEKGKLNEAHHVAEAVMTIIRESLAA